MKALPRRLPFEKLASSISIYMLSANGLPVIWQTIQSGDDAGARTTAGRALDEERSENGNRRTTTAPGSSTTNEPPHQGEATHGALVRRVAQHRKLRAQ